MPSFGGPPPFILSRGMRCFTPFVSIILTFLTSTKPEEDCSDEEDTLTSSEIKEEESKFSELSWEENTKNAIPKIVTTDTTETDTTSLEFNLE